MSLARGVRLGPYEITAQIGVGGMGEVWRATDTNLGRQVAIKVIPDAFAQDAERLSRFEREAKTLASLNHPNIATIHGLEKADGARALVMELVEGPTLADRIARGPLHVDEALAIAKQIADALEAAHEQGIVHRDLKPANVKVREDGTVKVLDFGLAKAIESTTALSDISHSPTITSPARTQAGVILGTAAYMSPEQARGRPVDKRSDIWAFGAVLYEMLTAKRAFQGEDISDVAAAILRSEPDWNALPASVPMHVRVVLRRCLQKDRKLRLHDIGDVRLELDDAAGSAATMIGPAPLRASSGARLRERLLWVAAAVLVSAATATGVIWWVSREAPLPEIRLEVSTPPTNTPRDFAVSPDGRRIVFAAMSDGRPMLWHRELDATTARPLAGTENAASPFWSPDSRTVAFVSAGKLRRLDLASGSILPVADMATTSGGGTWSSSNTILYQGPTFGLYQVPASGGEPARVTTLARGMGRHIQPQFLPDGRRFIYYYLGSPDVRGVYLGSLDSSESTRLTDADVPARFLPPDWLLMVRGKSLVAYRLDVSEGTLSDDSFPVAEGMSPDVIPSVTVSANGLIAYRAGAGSTTRQLTWFDRNGQALGTLGEASADLTSPALSPDGRRAAITRFAASRDIWVIDSVRAEKFTFDPASEAYPLWSPDGSTIAYTREVNDKPGEYRRPSIGAGPEEVLVLPTPPVQFQGMSDWSRDGRFILLDGNSRGTGSDVWVLPLEDKKPYLFLESPFAERLAYFSPNGRWVAYQSDESGRTEVYIRPFPKRPGQRPVSTGGGAQPRWRHDGKELYFISPDAKLMAASIVEKGDSIEAGAPAVLFQTRIFLGGSDQPDRGQYEVARDGRFLINTVIDDTTPPIIVVQNWSGARQ